MKQMDGLEKQSAVTCNDMITNTANRTGGPQGLFRFPERVQSWSNQMQMADAFHSEARRPKREHSGLARF
jgi:hypothetical protein